MIDWNRKHLSDLVCAFGPCKDDPTLSAPHREELSAAYAFAKQYSTLPNAGGTQCLVTAIAQLCNACRNTSRYECAGRSDWQQPCVLMRERGNP
jgi:hypothetical protein